MKKLFFILFVFLSVISFAQTQGNNPRVFNIRMFGGKSDGTYLFDVSTTNTSATITSASASFKTADIGKTILVNGAGAAGAVLRTTIASITNSTTAVLTATASATLSSDTLIYGSDNTAALQTAITTCANSGGGKVVAPVGIYLFSSALITKSNAQDTIPLNAGGTSKTKVFISIEGETVYGGSASGYLAAFTGATQTKGTIFYSTISGSGYMPCFIGSADTVTRNRNDFSISNLGVMVFSNHGATAVSVTPINGRMFQKINIKQCTISPDIEVNRTVSPASSEVAGIIIGGINNNGENMITETEIVGFKYGIVASEHTTLNGNLIFANINGIVLPASNHPIIGSSQIFACNNEIYSPTIKIFGQAAGASNINLNIASEWDTLSSSFPVGAWYKSVNNVSDSSSNLSGSVRLNIVANGVIANTTGAHTYGVDTSKLSVSTFTNPYAFTNKDNIFSTTQTFKTINNNTSNGIIWQSAAVNRFSLLSNFSAGTPSLYLYDNTTNKAKMFLNISGVINIGEDAFNTPALSIGATGISNFNNNFFKIDSSAGQLTQSAANPYFALNSPTNRQAAFIFNQNGSTKWQFGMDFANNGTAGFYVYDQANAKNRLYINTSGTVFIGADAFNGAATSGLNIPSTGLVGIGITATSTLHDGGSFALAYVAKTANYTAGASDQTINFTANADTLTLPTAVSITGRKYTIVNSGSSIIHIVTTSSQTFVNINAAPTALDLGAVGASAITSYTFMSNGANWIVTDKVKNE